MMMSMFSSFDILSGEFFGQKTNNMPSILSNKKSQPEAAKSDAGKSPSSPSQPQKQQGAESDEMRRRRRAMVTRFGVEFDGLNCFETILPC